MHFFPENVTSTMGGNLKTSTSTSITCQQLPNTPPVTSTTCTVTYCSTSSPHCTTSMTYQWTRSWYRVSVYSYSKQQLWRPYTAEYIENGLVQLVPSLVVKYLVGMRNGPGVLLFGVRILLHVEQLDSYTGTFNLACSSLTVSTSAFHE